MRSVTLHPGEDTDTECAVFVFQRPGGGSELENVERWYRQMGQELPSGGLAALPVIEVMERSGRLVKTEGTYASMFAEPVPDYGMLAVFVSTETHVLCVRMTGPAAVMRAEEGRFRQFCASLREP